MPKPITSFDEETEKTWLETYKPILLVFGYILGATLLVEVAAGGFDWMRWMRHFFLWMPAKSNANRIPR